MENKANPYAAPVADVRDVQADSHLQLAGRGVRLGASILDSLIAFLIIMLPPMMITGVGQFFTTATSVWGYRNLPLAALGAMAVGAIVLLAITWHLVKVNGQTIGKRALGIKVVRSDGSRASVARIFWIRNVPFWVVSIIPIAGPLISLVDILVIFRASRQTLHDQLADTVVVTA